MGGVEQFLATVPIFRDLSTEQLQEIAPHCREERFPAGTAILRQGGYSQALYFLRSGRLAVNVRKGDRRETVAHLQPPTVFGELSFITGRACSADVEVLVDADVVALPREAVPHLRNREAVLRSMMTLLAERLHDTVTKGAVTAPSPVVLLRSYPAWEARLSFAAELGRSLARQSGQETLVVNLGDVAEAELRPMAGNAFRCDRRAAASDESFRAATARSLTEWKTRFNNVVLNPVGPQALALAQQVEPFADTIGRLAGPGDALDETGEGRFIVQSAERPTLPVLDGRRQLIQDAAASESAWRAGGQVTERFQHTVDSTARAILGLQVGVALGGGAAWGWAHIGLLGVLERAGLPIDVVSGCSMGSVIGALYCAGHSVREMEEIALYWRTRTRRFIEWRFWRMCLLNEKAVRKTFRRYWGDRQVNQTQIPYWANAVDIKTGREYTILDGPIIEAVRASIALPGLLPPLARGEHLLLDAGIMDPVPVNLVQRMGASYAVAVNAMAALESQAINPHYPFNAFDIMSRCTRVMGHEIGQARAEEAADIVLTPTLGDITMLQFGRSPEIMDAGRKVAEEHLPAILAGYERLKTRVAAQQQEQIVRHKL